MQYVIREIVRRDYSCLKDFLYDSIFVHPGTPTPPRDIVEKPELQVYISGFGQSPHDTGLIAETDSDGYIGAIWTRIMDDYGHVDNDTPSLAMSVRDGYRKQGVGSRLLAGMLSILSEKGYARVSLSVQKENADALRLYEKAGFEVLQDKGEELIMVCRLGHNTPE